MNKSIIKFLKYLPWAWAQQIFVISLFLFFSHHMIIGGAILSSISIFSFLHFPNKFLMVLTFLVEGLFLYFYKDIFSLIWMTGIHSFIAVLCITYLPESITHGMRVLWNYYKTRSKNDISNYTDLQ